MILYDFRSDTVTRPTPLMRQRMAEAEVGDDVYQEDPTVNALEEKAAALLGKEAGLFVPSGVMGNTIGLKLHTQHGQEVICDARAHILNYELSMMAWFTGCLPRAIPTADGLLSWDRIAPEIRPLGPHAAPTACIEVENTHNLGGGTVYPLATLAEIYAGAKAKGLGVHMDGARLFHAATFLGLPVHQIAAQSDTVMFCLSKGLCAPVGSMLVGPRSLIDTARLLRKRLGGGMRQAGVLAAAGHVALDVMTQRLAEDHLHAQQIADALRATPGILVEGRVETNIIFFDVEGTGKSAAQFAAALEARGIRVSPFGPTRLRLVTHHDVPRPACQLAAAAIREVAIGDGPKA